MGRRRNWDRVRKENLVRLRGAESILEPHQEVGETLPSSESKAASEERKRTKARQALERQLEARETKKPTSQEKPAKCPWCDKVMPVSKLTWHLWLVHRKKEAKFASFKEKTRRG
jgi:hypothetical protein